MHSTHVQLFSELCNKGRLVAVWGKGSGTWGHQKQPGSTHFATLGVQWISPAALKKPSQAQPNYSPYVVYVEGSGTTPRDCKEHAAALAAELLLRSLCGPHSAAGGGIEAVWGNLLSNRSTMQSYTQRLAANMQLAQQQQGQDGHSLPPDAQPYAAPPDLYEAAGFASVSAGGQQQPGPPPFQPRKPEPWQIQVRREPFSVQEAGTLTDSG